MTVACPQCGRALSVPPDKAQLPNLKARCSGCQHGFVVAEAPPVAAKPVPPTPVPVRAAPAMPPPRSPSAPPCQLRARSGHERSRASVGRPRATSARGNWRRCSNHLQVRSEHYCKACNQGFCRDCPQPVGSAMLCPSCGGLCVPAADQEAREQRAAQRGRGMLEELPVILGYPLSDPVAYALLSIVVCVFGLASRVAAFGGGYAVLFTQGLLMAYSFTALNRVSSGRMQGFIPEIGDITDLARPLRLGFAALLISSGPMLVLLFVYPDVLVDLVPQMKRTSTALLPVAHAQETEQAPRTEGEADGEAQSPEGLAEEGLTPEQIEEERKLLAAEKAREEAEERVYEAARKRRRALALALFVVAGLWQLVYSPIALIVAGISQGFFQTLNPVVGVGAILKMEQTYWHAAAIYTVLALVRWGLALALSLIPFVGAVLQAFVDSYAWLAIGCALGLAVFKKAPELGLD